MSYFSYNYHNRNRNLGQPYFTTNFYKEDRTLTEKIEPVQAKSPEKTHISKVEQNSSMVRENSWTFFNNPKSEWEDRRKAIAEEYRKEMQAKFKEKIERDKNKGIKKSRNGRMGYANNQDFSYSVKYERRTSEEPKQTVNFNKSYVEKSVYDTYSYTPEKFSYYSPQIVKKSDQTPQKIQYSNDPSPDTSYFLSKANLTSDQNKSIREKQLIEWRKAVEEQLAEKQQKKEEEKSRKMMEDKLEEARIQKEVAELNKKFQKELKYESGDVEIETPPQPQPQYKPKFVRPVLEEKDHHAAKPEKRHIFKIQEDYNSRHNAVLQESGIRDIISKIRAEAYNAAAERQEVLAELEKMRTDLKNTRIFHPLSSVFPSVYRPPENVYPHIYNAGKQIISSHPKNLEETRRSPDRLKNFGLSLAEPDTKAADSPHKLTNGVPEEFTETSSVFITESKKTEPHAEVLENTESPPDPPELETKIKDLSNYS